MRWQEELRQLAPGASMVRLTDGRYGRLHVLRELLDMAGPGADVLAVTWCIGPIELATLAQMVRRGTTTVRLLVDAEQFRATLGRGRAPRDIRVDVRCSKVHAKIDLVRSPRGAWAICGSMNLNPNRRLEQWVALAGLGAERLSADLERVWDVAMSPARAQGAPAAFWRVGAQRWLNGSALDGRS